jgi:hypothetical protein
MNIDVRQANDLVAGIGGQAVKAVDGLNECIRIGEPIDAPGLRLRDGAGRVSTVSGNGKKQ